MIVRDAPRTIFGGVVAALGIAVVIAARRIPSGFSYDAVGPALFPTLIGAGLVASGALTIAGAALRDADGEVRLRNLRWWTVGLVSIVLLLEAFLIGKLGWIPVAAVVFAAGARVFDDRRWVANLAIGVALAAVVLAAFNYGLGLDLPVGPLEPLLQRFQQG